VARTVFLDELLVSACEDDCRQVVLLGAGFDSRAFRLPWPPGVRCFELDTADVLESKAQVLASNAAVPRCERVPVACDLRADWPRALLAVGFAPGQPTAWVAEGLLVYLTSEEVDGVLADLTALTAPGSRLGLTMSTRDPGAAGHQVSPSTTRRHSSAPDDPVRWLAGHGWSAQLTEGREVLRAHGRLAPSSPVDPAPGSPRSTRPRGLLISATRSRLP
jgi:methyltransferase (TIGR00027 family)